MSPIHVLVTATITRFFITARTTFTLRCRDVPCVVLLCPAQPFFLAKFFKYYMDSREVPTTTRYAKYPADLTCGNLLRESEIPVQLPTDAVTEHTWLSVVFEQPRRLQRKRSAPTRSGRRESTVRPRRD